MISNAKLENVLDRDAFKSIKMGGVVGMAALGFAGMFAIQSSNRRWLGPSAGFGGEYSERHKRKNEHEEYNMDIKKRLEKRHIMMSPRLAQSNTARLMPPSIKPPVANMSEVLHRLSSPDMPEARNYTDFTNL
jgi:hypothetical protein